MFSEQAFSRASISYLVLDDPPILLKFFVARLPTLRTGWGCRYGAWLDIDDFLETVLLDFSVDLDSKPKMSIIF